MDLNYNKIILEFESFIKSSTITENTKLCSFGFQVNNADWFNFTQETISNYADISFFKTADNQFTFVGINSAINLESWDAATFSNVSENFYELKKNLVNNWINFDKQNVPIIFCSAKFDSTKSSSLWEEFEPLRIYIPELIIEISDNKTYGYFNFQLNKNHDYQKSINKLSSLLNSLTSLIHQKVEVSPEISSFSENDDEYYSNWTKIFENAFNVLQKGEVNKLVLSKFYELKIDGSIKWSNLLKKLNNRFPDCYLFLIKRNNSIFFGSSPEMFLKVSGNLAEVESVAGSVARGKLAESDKQLEKFLRTSGKNQKEHLIVSDFISEILIKYSNNVRVVEEKQIRKLDNIQHLITKISADLNFKTDIFSLIDSLFPTPAVCGTPKEKAKEIIKSLEAHDRGLYSGLVGIFDFDQNCEIAVAIRSALVKKNIVTAFAGAGIIGESDMKEEFEEIKLKLSAILSLFSNET